MYIFPNIFMPSFASQILKQGGDKIKNDRYFYE